jgi:hypothetical protein
MKKRFRFLPLMALAIAISSLSVGAADADGENDPQDGGVSPVKTYDITRSQVAVPRGGGMIALGGNPTRTATNSVRDFGSDADGLAKSESTITEHYILAAVNEFIREGVSGEGCIQGTSNASIISCDTNNISDPAGAQAWSNWTYHWWHHTAYIDGEDNVYNYPSF